MARKARIDQAGFYYVLNRGVEKRDIYLDDQDRYRFLADWKTGSDPDNLLFLQLILHKIQSKKALDCTFQY